MEEVSRIMGASNQKERISHTPFEGTLLVRNWLCVARSYFLKVHSLTELSMNSPRNEVITFMVPKAQDLASC